MVVCNSKTWLRSVCSINDQAGQALAKIAEWERVQLADPRTGASRFSGLVLWLIDNRPRLSACLRRPPWRLRSPGLI